MGLTFLPAWLPLQLGAVLTGYLKIDDIPGESQRVDHEDEIDIHDITWKIEVANAEDSTRERRVQVGALKMKKYIDKASPYLALASLSGRVLPTVTLAVRKDSGEAHLDYLIITMENVQVTSYEVKSTDESATASSIPVEEIGLKFSKITYKYVEQNDDHSAGDEHEITYDIAAGP